MLVRSEFLVTIVCISVSISQCQDNEAATTEMSRTIFGCKLAPQQCPSPDITFWLYTRSTQTTPRVLNLSDSETIKSEWFEDAPFVILVHGYTGDHDYAPNTQIRPALFQYGEFNVLSVDYEPLARSPCYFSAVRNLKVVANCTAQLIDQLVKRDIAPLKSFHPIGFSLGGHVVGMIGNFLQSGQLSRVTSLDPAKPLFMTAPAEDRIGPEDADFVDVIHTDALERGLLMPTGHVDFYMNGGFAQPGCEAEREMSYGSCNHARAPIYFAESINSETGFWGYKCPHWYAYAIGLCRRDNNQLAIMGMHTPQE
ncbi:pancreatic lipase-related protein 2 [Sergentomyia squamirostris]